MTVDELEARIEEIDEVIDEMLQNWNDLMPEEERKFWRVKAVQQKYVNELAQREYEAERFYGVDANLETFGDW